ncbi:uncharacterized protein PAF06_012018 [Gastrophryne carolinensis]
MPDICPKRLWRKPKIQAIMEKGPDCATCIISPEKMEKWKKCEKRRSLALMRSAKIIPISWSDHDGLLLKLGSLISRPSEYSWSLLSDDAIVTTPKEALLDYFAVNKTPEMIVVWHGGLCRKEQLHPETQYEIHYVRRSIVYVSLLFSTFLRFLQPLPLDNFLQHSCSQAWKGILFNINQKKMGRGNSIGTECENRQAKSLPMKMILPKNDNNNQHRVVKKCAKVSAEAKKERIIQTNITSSFSSTLGLQNRNLCDLQSVKNKPHVSTATSHQTVSVTQVLNISNTKNKNTSTSTSKSQKEVFKFWSTKVIGQDSPDGKMSRPKTLVKSNLILMKSTSDGPSTENGGEPQTTSTPTGWIKRKKREEVFSASAVRHIDDYVLSVSNQIKSENVSLQDIVQKITKMSSNNLEKLRAVWIWLCHNISYDVDGFLGRSPKLYRTEDLLKLRKGVCAGYAGLCKEMCREIGILCEEVSGFSRGAEYSDCDSFHRTKSNHMWNAVEIDGEWYLLDACWGAGTVDLQNATFIPSYDDFFFLTDPEDFIKTHWPDDPSWQLLHPQVSFEEFEQCVFQTSEFFRLHLFIISPNIFSLTTENGEVKVSLGCESPMEYSYKVFQLLKNSRSLTDKSCGILTVHDSCMTLRLFMPSAGQFELMIFAKLANAKDPYKWVCSYQVNCPQARQPFGLPENPFHFWGLPPNSKCLGITNCCPREDLIVAENGTLNFVFETTRPLLAMFQLLHAELSEPVSKKCLVSQIEDNRLCCHLLLPYWGYYRLSLFVKEQQKDNFQNAANMFINCRNPINHNELFPPDLSVHCGPGTNTKLNGLTNPSHTSPIIITTSGLCNITFHTLWDMDVLPILENDKLNNSLHSLDQYCFLTHLEHKISLTIHLPVSGNYKFSIFTKAKKDDEYSHACDYIIQCFSSNCLLPFPKVYSAWGPGCILLQPRYGLLSAESWEHFRLKIPGACKVLVIGPFKTELQQSKNNIWEGKVFTGSQGSLIKIAVKTTPNSTTMDIVMSFRVRNNNDNDISG